MSSENFSERENPIGDYLLNEEIGSGGFAKVVQGIHIPTGEKVAVKIMDKAQIFSEPLNLNRIQREIAILKIVRHKNIIKLYELMETPNKIYLVMEYCNGGELFDYIVSKQHLTERQACRFFQEIINSIEYLHSLNIVHRDLKPENLLLDKINNKITLKLIDFGISNCYSPEKLLNTPCGTASYAPPEMHRGEEYYGLLSDVWSAGVVLYAMAFGYLPFCEDDEDTNINNIIEGNYEIPEEASPELADLLIHLLDINPLTRYDLEQIKQHPWFNMIKRYKYIPGVIEGYHRIPIDMKIVEACEQYGYDKEKVIESVQKCKYNRNSSVYYIILSKMKREGYHSISDLYSDEFLRYIKDRKNIIYKTEDNTVEISGDEDNNIENEVFINNDSDNTERNKDKNVKKINKNDKKNKKKKITRHQSHPVGENNLTIEDESSFEFNEEKYKKIINKQKNNKEEIKQSKEKNNNNNDEKRKVTKNSEKKEIKSPVYKKPKVKDKKHRNEKRSQIKAPKCDQSMKNITLSSSNQITKNNNNNNNISIRKDSQKSKVNKKEKENNKQQPNKNNHSFSQTKKTKSKKEKKNNKYKDNYPKIVKKSENSTLKTEIIRKSIDKKMMPICSFHVMSKTKDALNRINNNEAVDVDFMNTSFTKKLSDDIKEKILKLKNPKQKIPQKEKEKKINNALLSLKMKKQRKKGNYNYNSKQSNKNKKIKMGARMPIFKDGNRKDHTIIHNRNASACVDTKINKNKNLSSEKNKNRKDYSLSPNIRHHDSHDRRNIINIYVQNKNNINSNNVYNINLITKGNYSIDKSNKNRKNDHYNNIKVKKIKMKQNFKSIEQNFSVHSNNYLNTANMSFSNRNRKNVFQTPNKSNQNLYMDKSHKLLLNCNIQNPIKNKNHRNANKGKQFSQKSNSIENRFFKNKNKYNNSFNDFYSNNNNDNKKKIRINFKPIEEKEYDDLNNSKKLKIDKINSNQKMSESLSNTKRINYNNNNKPHHYKSRSMMDNENPFSLKNNISLYKDNKNNKDNNNYTITENKKITKVRSTASAGEIVKSNNNHYYIKKKNKLINISYMNLHTTDSNRQMLEPRRYKGPIDLNCLLVSNSLNLLIEKITNLLKKYKINKIVINPYKFKCSKNGESFDIEFLSLNNNLSKNNNNNCVTTSSDMDIKYKTITETPKNRSNNLYYYTLVSKINKNKNLIKLVSKLINSRFGINKIKK